VQILSYLFFLYDWLGNQGYYYDHDEHGCFSKRWHKDIVKTHVVEQEDWFSVYSNTSKRDDARQWNMILVVEMGQTEERILNFACCFYSLFESSSRDFEFCLLFLFTFCIKFERFVILRCLKESLDYRKGGVYCRFDLYGM